jgi:hypothetical protein
MKEMLTKMTCDRCQKEEVVKNEQWWTWGHLLARQNNGSNNITEKPTGDWEKLEHKQKDLCPSCYDLLYDWWKKKGVDNARS